ncbi:Motility protein B [Polystyrenella longa]|uniref:Motility protein B n=1 Tax=Polystyrenella longa TaxID=2528007 RepID=A0A518CIW0_9PLAN|nr:OmpA family protein [Polystyrenella longa]QDU79124.1 Motility protein B [Polystyrenella longa]
MAKKNPKPPPDDPPPGVPEWVVTYGDMMSLLLTFFIMLVSMSEIRSDSGEARAAMDSIRQSFGPSLGTFGVPGRSTNERSSYGKMASSGRRSEGGVKEASHDSVGRGGAYDPVQRISNGSRITLGGPILFKPFSAELTKALRNDLDTLAEVMKKKEIMIMIRGHATPEQPPASSGYRDPLDLSFQRANNVYTYLVSKGIKPSHMHVNAVGSAEPRFLTSDSKKQAFNRRVDVFLMDSYIQSDDKPQQ